MGAAWTALAGVRRLASRVATGGLDATGLAKTLAETASSRWYLLIECLPHVLGSIAMRFVLADVLNLELFAVDVVGGFANSAIFVSEWARLFLRALARH